MWPLKTILYFALFWIGCAAALVNPVWGVVNYLMAYQTHPGTTWWGLPLANIGMRFSLYAISFTVVGLILGRNRMPIGRPGLTLWEGALLLLLANGFFSLLIGVTYDHRSAMAIEKLWKMMFFVFILTRVGSSRNNLRLILASFVVGSLYVGYDAYTANPSDFLLGRLNRIGGPDFATSSGTAAHLSAMLPIIGAFFLTSRSWFWRVTSVVSGALTVNAIVLCRTRSAFIGLLVGIFAALLTAPRVRRWRIQILLVIGALCAFSLTDTHYWTRMTTLTDDKALQKDVATISRTEIWKRSLDILADYPLGIGVGNFARVIGRYDERYAKRSTHNTVVVCFVELGVQGGVMFLAMAAMSLAYLAKVATLAPCTGDEVETKLIAYGLFVSCVTYFVTGLGTERFYCESFWWVLAMPICLYRAVLSEVTKPLHDVAEVRAGVGSDDENEELGFPHASDCRPHGSFA